MFKAEIRITLRPSILDPQGKAIHHAVQSLGYASVESVRMGKYAEVMIAETDRARAEAVARDVCAKLLANPVMEDFAFTLEPVG